MIVCVCVCVRVRVCVCVCLQLPPPPALRLSLPPFVYLTRTYVRSLACARTHALTRAHTGHVADAKGQIHGR